MATSLNLKIAWGYLSELVLSGAMFGLLWLVFGGESIRAFTTATANEWNDLTGMLFSAALAIWITFVNIRAMPFGDYLHRIGAEKQITVAFICAMAVFFCATITLTVCAAVKRPEPAYAAMFLLIYSLINTYTMIRNSTLLIKLYGKYNQLAKTVSAETMDTPRLAAQPPGNES